MKKLIPLILLIIIVAGCSTEGDIKFINRTEHPLYFTVKGDDYILEGSEDVDDPNTKSISIDTGSKFLFWGGDTEKVDLYLEGETFLMQEADLYGNPSGLYTAETTLQVEPDETTKIYCDPTHAGVKLVNSSLSNIIEFSYSSNYGNYITINDDDIPPGESFWARLNPSSPDNTIFYSFRVTLDDYRVFILDAGELGKDDQFEWYYYD